LDNSTFWFGLAIGAIISFVVSIVANIYTPKIRAMIDKRSAIRLNNKKTVELEDYAIAKGIAQGAPVAIQKLQSVRFSSLRMMMYAIGFLILAVFGAVVLYGVSGGIEGAKRIILKSFITFSWISGMAVMYVSLRLSLSALDIVRKADKLDEYEETLRKKWGADAI